MRGFSKRIDKNCIHSHSRRCPIDFTKSESAQEVHRRRGERETSARRGEKKHMVISPLILILIVVILLALAGSGHGYYNGGGYANPLAFLGGLLIIGLIIWLIFGGGISLSPPTERPRIEI